MKQGVGASGSPVKLFQRAQALLLNSQVLQWTVHFDSFRLSNFPGSSKDLEKDIASCCSATARCLICLWHWVGNLRWLHQIAPQSWQFLLSFLAVLIPNLMFEQISCYGWFWKVWACSKLYNSIYQKWAIETCLSYPFILLSKFL